MAAIESVILEVDDPKAAQVFYSHAFSLDDQIGFRASDAPTTGFRGFTMSLVVSQPGTVDSLVGSAIEAGATSIKPVKKSMWGYGGVVQAPDGTIWQVASSSKKDSGAATRAIDEIVLLLGVDNIGASKRFYLDQGFPVEKSFGPMYVQFSSTPGKITLTLNRRRSLAKISGVSPDGSGSHRIVISSDAGTFTDPDGFVWEPARVAQEV